MIRPSVCNKPGTDSVHYISAVVGALHLEEKGPDPIESPERVRMNNGDRAITLKACPYVLDILTAIDAQA